MSDRKGVPDGSDVNWATVWDQAGLDRESALSSVQLGLAISIADETGAASEGNTQTLVTDALDAGHLQPRQSLTPQGSVIVSGYELPPAQREQEVSDGSS